jgi:tripartite-type tricarboxylate transporter receptor subunit TctC
MPATVVSRSDTAARWRRAAHRARRRRDRSSADVIAKLNAAVVDALADSSVRARLTELGQEIPALDQQSPNALGVLQKAEVEKWAPVIKAANIKPE